MLYHAVRGLQCSVVPTQRLQWREEVTAASANMSVSGNWNVTQVGVVHATCSLLRVLCLYHTFPYSISACLVDTH